MGHTTRIELVTQTNNAGYILRTLLRVYSSVLELCS